jgi:hypothetical protein
MLFRDLRLNGWQQFAALDIHFHNRLTVLDLPGDFRSA